MYHNFFTYVMWQQFRMIDCNYIMRNDLISYLNRCQLSLVLFYFSSSTQIDRNWHSNFTCRHKYTSKVRHFHYRRRPLQKGLFNIWGPTFLTSWSILKNLNKKWHFFYRSDISSELRFLFCYENAFLRGKFRKSVNPHIF